MELAGMMIRRERLRRGWSQEGLCRGICAASYLSKLEQGKARPSPEVLALLFERLGLQWALEPEVEALLARCRALLLEGDQAGFRRSFSALQAREQTLMRSRQALDFLLLQAFYADEHRPLPEDCEPFMTPPQRALQLALKRDYAAATALEPAPFYRMMEGVDRYRQGEYALAMEALQQAYDRAAEQGLVRLMLLSRTYLGNCCSDLGSMEQLRQHYAVARRLALALGDDGLRTTIDYNLASSQLEQGDAAAAYAYFSGLEAPSVLALHKLAICCEQLGKRQEGLAALDRAETNAAAGEIAPELAQEMLALVRFRLEQPDFLQRPEYGARLLETFAHIRAELPMGYVRFHLPYVLKWYEAARQYRQAYLLRCEFS